MSDSPLLQMPYLAASQAQKHVTHNEALSLLDGLVHLAVVSRVVATPPASPTDGQRYLIPAAPTGEWVGRIGRICATHGRGLALFDPAGGVAAVDFR